MSDNTIRAIIVLTSPLLVVLAITLGIVGGLIFLWEEIVPAWRYPQSLRFKDWKLWS